MYVNTHLKGLLHESSSFKYYLALKMMHPMVVLLKSHTQKRCKNSTSMIQNTLQRFMFNEMFQYKYQLQDRKHMK